MSCPAMIRDDIEEEVKALQADYDEFIDLLKRAWKAF